MTKKTAAFFDIDGTLYREGLITEIFKKLIKSEIIESKRWYNEVREHYIKWDKRIGNYDNYLLKMAEIYIDAIKGLHKTQIDFIAQKVIEQKGDRVYTFTRDRIEWHKKQNHLLITISGSPSELVEQMSKKHGFDDYIGTEYILDSNKFYTSEVLPMWDSENKLRAINYFINKYNIDLESSYAYGDTAGDYSMLNIVGNPTAINPTKELIEKISENDEIRNKINIVVERKDMIYKLDFDSINNI